MNVEFEDDMENVMVILQKVDILNLICVFIMLWYFSRHIDEKIDQQSKRTDRLYEMFVDLLKHKNDSSGT